MADILADEHIPFRLVDCLRLLGHKVATVRQFAEDKRGGAWSDEEVLQFAIARKWALITFNADDFVRLARRVRWHYGIVLAEPEEDKRAQARRIDDLIKATTELRGLIVDTRSSSSQLPRQKRRKR